MGKKPDFDRDDGTYFMHFLIVFDVLNYQTLILL